MGIQPQIIDGRNWLTPDYSLLRVRETRNAGQRAKKPEWFAVVDSVLQTVSQNSTKLTRSAIPVTYRLSDALASLLRRRVQALENLLCFKAMVLSIPLEQPLGTHDYHGAGKQFSDASPGSIRAKSPKADRYRKPGFSSVKFFG